MSAEVVKRDRSGFAMLAMSVAAIIMVGLSSIGCAQAQKLHAGSGKGGNHEKTGGSGGAKVAAGDNLIESPDGNIKATVTFDQAAGTVSYKVTSRGTSVIASSPIGIETSRGDFRSGMKLAGGSREVIDETYKIPQGKVSTYHNHANEIVLKLMKGGTGT